MDLIYISILFAAIAFAIVAGYLCFILKRLSNTLKSLGTTMSEVEEQFKYITPQLSETIRETDRLVDDTTVKVKATDGIFDTVEDFGTSITAANDAFQNTFGRMTDEEMDREVRPFIAAIRWSEVGTRLYSGWKENKKADKNELMIRTKNEIVEVSGREG